MTDIVEKLRRYRPTYGWPEERSVIVEPTMNHVAADEIERLREALREIHGLGDTPDDSWKAYQICCKALGEKE